MKTILQKLMGIDESTLLSAEFSFSVPTKVSEQLLPMWTIEMAFALDFVRPLLPRGKKFPQLSPNWQLVYYFNFCTIVVSSITSQTIDSGAKSSRDLLLGNQTMGLCC